MAETRALVLFDIDGTLLRRAGPHHRQVLEDAVLAVTGLKTSTDGVPVAGMLDRDIVRKMMEAVGAKPAFVRANLPAIMDKAQNLYVRRCPDLRSKVCPGVRGALRRLSRRAVLGLVTGNLSRIGWRKMEQAGLREHFQYGMFAEQGATRAALARAAVREARLKGWIGRGSAVTLIGDHPNDIAAAREAGIRVVAVGTGIVSMEDLAFHSPDQLVADLRQLDLEWLLCA